VLKFIFPIADPQCLQLLSLLGDFPELTAGFTAASLKRHLQGPPCQLGYARAQQSAHAGGNFGHRFSSCHGACDCHLCPQAQKKSCNASPISVTIHNEADCAATRREASGLESLFAGQNYAEIRDFYSKVQAALRLPDNSQTKKGN
jgi:hypothetical protein